MGKSIQKFVPVTDGKFGKATSIERLATMGNCDQYLQYMGLKALNSVEIYEGSVLELRITNALMDPQKNLFYNSNLGKAVSEDPSIKSVLCVMGDKANKMHCPYTVYFAREDGVICDEKDKLPKEQAVGYDTLFPSYLCEKGAVVIGNTAVTPDIVENVTRYSMWNLDVSMMNFTSVNVDGNKVDKTYKLLSEFKDDWFSSNCGAPSLDDEVIKATVCGSRIHCETFLDVVKYIESITGWKL